MLGGAVINKKKTQMFRNAVTKLRTSKPFYIKEMYIFYNIILNLTKITLGPYVEPLGQDQTVPRGVHIFVAREVQN